MEGGPMRMTALGDVDVVLWDIKAKAANMPLYHLLGGRSRDRIMAYTHANGKDLDSTLEAVAQAKAQGYKAIRVQCGIPGIAKTYGVAKDDASYEPADSALPSEESWSRSEEHTSELQSRGHLVCRLLLEK